MKHVPRRDQVGVPQPGASAPLAVPDPDVLRLRTVHRAAADLRRGTPVLLTGEAPLILLAAETAGPRGLAELAVLAAQPPVLLLAPMRAAAVLHQPVEQGSSVVALIIVGELLAPESLRGLADPTVEELLPTQPEPAAVPALASAALILAKLGRLLPAVLAAPVRPDVAIDAERFGLFSVPATDLMAYPVAAAAGLRQIASARVPLENAPDSRVVAFRTEGSAIEHLAIVVGHPETAEAPLVRIHSECFTGDLLGSLRCDCGAQLRGAIARMADEGAGVLLYLAQEGRNIGLVNKLRAYTLQDRGLDTLDANRALGWGADERNFLIAATMLQAIGVNRIRLLTNNPEKLAALAACGVEVIGREAHAFAPNGVNDHYLATKAERFGHLLD
ncbi:MAG TPA: GTP cyclohydrolase II [Acetobacteraceae bacterium]|nr:GTP cyclohydrolase II [Acetobacteraceae bacterium]